LNIGANSNVFERMTNQKDTTEPSLAQRSSSSSSSSSSWIKWIKDIFIMSPGEASPSDAETDGSSSNSSNNIQLTAHVDADYGPLQWHFNRVLRSIAFSGEQDDIHPSISSGGGGDDEEEDAAISRQYKEQDDMSHDENTTPRLSKRSIKERRREHGQQFEQQLQRAERMRELMELMPTLGLLPSIWVLGLVLRAYEFVGTIESAQTAEEIYKENRQASTDSNFSFQTVLRAYRLAAVLERNPEVRNKAAARIQELIREEELNNEETVDNARKRVIVYTMALQALSNAGRDAIPDRCERAENLVKTCIGKETFGDLFHSNPKYKASGMHMLLLNELLNIYAATEDRERLEKAKKLLSYMEGVREIERTLSRSRSRKKPAQAEKDVSMVKDELTVPSTDTYAIVLQSIDHMWFRGANTEERMLEDAKYASSLLDNMVSYPHSWPTMEICDQLFRFWIRVKTAESGPAAEEILNRMEMRQFFDPTLKVTWQTYLYVIRCWKHSAVASFPGAAERAFRLVERMEARSGMSGFSKVDVSASNDRESEMLQTAYVKDVRPDIHIYELMLRVCSHVRLDQDKAKSMEIARSVHDRIIENGLEPSTETYMLLLWCCANLLPRSEERSELGSYFFELAREKGLVNHSLVQSLRKVDGALATSFNESGEPQETMEVEEAS
jgi:hypothetical protein